MSIEPLPEMSKAHSWVVVTQVKSHRIVYFTDDPDYQPPMQGDWYYVSPFEGPLPEAMTLRNCWRWRFNGMEFVDAGLPKPLKREASLLQSNKLALLELLGQRIDVIRRPLEPSALGGAELRARKLTEARAVLNHGSAEAPLLSEVAAAHHCSVDEMARRVIEHDRRRTEILLQTELQREIIATAIQRATTQQELLVLRARIVDEVAAEQAEPKPHSPENTTPEKLKKPLDAGELASEQLRLRVQLRNRVNDLRRPNVSQYLLDDYVLGRKVEIAAAVQRAGGALPPGLDGALLLSHAAARGQRLADAAQDVLAESREIRSALVVTEQMKDATLVRIASAKSLADIRDIGRAIERLALPNQQEQPTLVSKELA